MADTTQQALEEYVPGLIKRRELMKRLREPWESKDRPSPVGYKSVEQISVDVALSTGDVLTLSSNMGSFFGSPQQLKEQIAELRDLGVRNLMLTHYGQVVSPEKQANSMRLLSEKGDACFQRACFKSLSLNSLFHVAISGYQRWAERGSCLHGCSTDPSLTIIVSIQYTEGEMTWITAQTSL